MSQKIFGRVESARTVFGWQVWVWGTSDAIAFVETEREAKRLVARLSGLKARVI